MGVDYSKYYTPLAVAEQLASLISFADDSKVIDICCGSCNLLSAANSVNKTLQCLGVDIHPSNLFDYDTVQSDGRLYAIKHIGEYDYALANPPFGRTEDSEYSTLLAEKSSIGIINSRIEIQMLVANLLLLKKGGTLLIILPSTVVDGPSSVNIRRKLAQKYFIKTIVDMPINAFQPRRIKCSALIIENTLNTSDQPTTLYSMHSDFHLNRECILPKDAVIRGQWSSQVHTNCKAFTVVQGKISSGEFTKNGIEVLHTAKMKEDWKPSTRYTSLEHADKNLLKVKSGDIIISRVGASAGAVHEYTGAATLVSDCLLIVKEPSEIVRSRILAMDLKKIVKGLSTPHITASGIYDLYGATYEDK